MRYILDTNGYVFSASFACDLEGGTLYTGEVPSGYKTLFDWATTACIQAYYLDNKGNLILDYSRKNEIENLQVQQAIDYSPVLRKDIFETEETVTNQYIRETATGKVITLSDIKTISPKLKITNIPPECIKLSVFTQGRNMMPCDAQSGVVSGVTFTKNASGSITVLGTATENIEYTIADGKSDAIFILKGNTDYYLNLGGLDCELIYFDGETTAQKYIGASGLLHLEESIEVTKVVLKIPNGKSINTTFYPQLERGTEFTKYELHRCSKVDIDIAEQIAELLYPEETLYAKDTLYPGATPKSVDYILIEEGKVIISIEEELSLHSMGRISLFSNYTTLYCDKDVDLELEYSSSVIDVDTLEFLQGKSTTTNKFTILKDGSIEAKDGYFSGTIHANNGYFRGTIEFENLYDENGNPIFDIITTITRSTVTTAYVDALGVTAGSVRAENITGTTISGKTLFGNTISGGEITGSTIKGGSISIGSYFSVDNLGNVTANSLTSNNATISGGKIAGFTIDSFGIRNGKYSINDDGAGIYIGIDGINIGYKSAFKVTSQGDVTIGNIGGLTLGSSAKIDFVGGTISVEDDGVYLGSDRSTQLKSGELRIGGSYNYYTTIEQNKITFGSGTTGSIYHGSNSLMSVTSTTVSMSNSAIIGGASGKVGFFGNAGSTKKTVTTITASSPTASTVATKVNELINALKAYNLI